MIVSIVATGGGELFFQAGVRLSIENATFLPILTNLGYVGQFGLF